ncbi:MAG TPA: outer membrane beta-barrel protein [Rhizomicrobium sp.]|jgi:opacity protein-like surface antigen
MKIWTRTILAGASVLAAVGPAAAGDGYYVGLGAGWDNQNKVDLTAPLVPGSGTVSAHDGAIIAGTLGYKMPEMPIRLEFESGYDWHSINSATGSGGLTADANGHSNIASELVNALYDFPVAPGWNLYGGAGVGAGHVWFAPNLANSGDTISHVDHWGFMWQAIGGASLEIAPDVDLFADYRYRDAEARSTTQTPLFGPVTNRPITENVVMAGLRFYMFPPMSSAN